MWEWRLTGPGLLERRTVPDRALPGHGDGDVLVRTLAGGLCGSDRPHFRRGPVTGTEAPAPLHEIVGEVLETRSDRLSLGDRVVGWATNMDGLAERVVTRSDALVRVPPGQPPELAVLAQPLACVLAAARRLPDVSGAWVSVLGLGPIGLLWTHVLHTLGARRVTGVDPVDRSAVADAFGVDDLQVRDSTCWSARLGSDRPGLVVEAVGHQVTTVRDAVSAVHDGGTVYCFGIPERAPYPVDMTRLVRGNLTVLGGVTTDKPAALSDALAYQAAHPGLARLVTDVLPVDRAPAAYHRADRPGASRLKVVLTASHPSREDQDG